MELFPHFVRYVSGVPHLPRKVVQDSIFRGSEQITSPFGLLGFGGWGERGTNPPLDFFSVGPLAV